MVVMLVGLRDELVQLDSGSESVFWTITQHSTDSWAWVRIFLTCPACVCAGRGAIFRPKLPSNSDLPSNHSRTSPPAKTILVCETSNGDLPSNHGRTSPPATKILACEPINLCLRPVCAHTITLRARARLRTQCVTSSRRHGMSRHDRERRN